MESSTVVEAGKAGMSVSSWFVFCVRQLTQTELFGNGQSPLLPSFRGGRSPVHPVATIRL
ncbi:hypothetical protein ACVWWK_000883 [Bradyrhizobium sp. LB9.1b]